MKMIFVKFMHILFDIFAFLVPIFVLLVVLKIIYPKFELSQAIGKIPDFLIRLRNKLLSKK